MRKYLFASVAFWLSAGKCYAQWTDQDSLKLKELLERSETLQLNKEAVRQIDFGGGHTRPLTSEEKNWLLPDESLPEGLPAETPQVRFTLKPYTAQTRYDWDPVYRKKIRVTKDTWRGEPWERLYARNRYSGNSLHLGKGVTARGILQRGADFLSSPAAVHCYGAAGVGIGGLDLMAVFSKKFWDVKGRERREHTLRALRTYGDSTTVAVNQPFEQISR